MVLIPNRVSEKVELSVTVRFFVTTSRVSGSHLLCYDLLMAAQVSPSPLFVVLPVVVVSSVSLGLSMKRPVVY